MWVVRRRELLVLIAGHVDGVELLRRLSSRTKLRLASLNVLISVQRGQQFGVLLAFHSSEDVFVRLSRAGDAFGSAAFRFFVFLGLLSVRVRIGLVRRLLRVIVVVIVEVVVTGFLFFGGVTTGWRVVFVRC